VGGEAAGSSVDDSISLVSLHPPPTPTSTASLASPRMLLPPLSLLALCLASPAFAATAGSFADGGNTLISVMMVNNFFHWLWRRSY